MTPYYVSLRAFYSSIVDVERRRVFSYDEHNRIRVMIAEGYGSRPFSDLILETDEAGFAVILARLESETRHMIAQCDL